MLSHGSSPHSAILVTKRGGAPVIGVNVLAGASLNLTRTELADVFDAYCSDR